MYPTSSQDLNKETEEGVYFFTPAFYPLDNYSAHQVEIWGKKFATVEHAYQWKKFVATKPDIAEKIFLANSPEAAKKIADDNKSFQPDSWQEEKVGAMEQILTAKAEQHEDVQDALKRSGKRQIHENSPVDEFWGLGASGKGKSMVGKIWMKIRDSEKN